MAARGVDRRLDVLRRRIDVAVEIELHRDRGQPSALVEVICDTPEICANCRSSGCATDDAIVSGLAPGNVRRDLDRGKIDLRQRRDRQQRVGREADQEDAAMSSDVAIGRRMKGAETPLAIARPYFAAWCSGG